MPISTQLVVIGAGPGGYAAAFYAADRGMKVTLVDPEKNPGGVCVYRGCIPSKALLHVTVVEMTDGLLPGADRDLVAILARRIEQICEAVWLNTKVTGMKEVKDGIA